MEHTPKKTSALSIVLGISIFTIISWVILQPVFRPGFFPMHDDTQVARVKVMSQALSQGQFPVRWVSDLGFGYGYPIYNFYGPLPYYIGAVFTYFGFSALIATKIMFAVGIVLLGVSTFFLVASLWGAKAGLVAGILALLAPYHAVQIYVRGAVGEFWSSAFIPLVLLGYILVGVVKSRRLGILIGGVGLAAVILSHTLTGFVAAISCFVFILGYILSVVVKKLPWEISKISAYVAILLIGLGLTAFFWLPAFGEMHFTSVSGQIGASASYKDHFVCLSQFWNSPWGFGGSIPGCIDGLSFKLGKVYIVLGLLGLMIWSRSKKSINASLVSVGVALVIGGIVFATPISAFLWAIVPKFAYIQYPWRFIIVIELGLAILASAVVLQKSRYVSSILVGCVIALAFWNNAYLFAPKYNYPRLDSAFETQEELRFRVSKISDEYLPSELSRPTKESDVIFDTIEATGPAVITKIRDDVTSAEYSVSTQNDVEIRINKAFFPGWRYWINGLEVFPKIVYGLPRITVPYGTTEITMRFEDTLIRKIGNILSFCFVVGLVIYYGKSKKSIA